MDVLIRTGSGFRPSPARTKQNCAALTHRVIASVGGTNRWTWLHHEHRRSCNIHKPSRNLCTQLNMQSAELHLDKTLFLTSLESPWNLQEIATQVAHLLVTSTSFLIWRGFLRSRAGHMLRDSEHVHTVPACEYRSSTKQSATNENNQNFNVSNQWRTG